MKPTLKPIPKPTHPPISTCTNIVAGVYVARPPVTNFAGMNLSLANAAHPLQNCR